MLNILESSGNYSLSRTLPPQSSGARVISYALGAYMVHMEGMLI
jgi:hypothetical protein